MELSSRRIVVVGGSGFLGRHVVRSLRERGCHETVVPGPDRYDLTREAAVEQLYRDTRPHVVIHLASRGGGDDPSRPGSVFYENLITGALLMEHGRRAGVEKLVVVGTACAYPEHAPIPFCERDLWSGYPAEASAPQGLAERVLVAQALAYRQQYGFGAVCLLTAELYGPGDDDPEATRTVPALVRTCLEARDAGLVEVVCRGDGASTRELLYVEDCAEAVVVAAEQYGGSEPVNIGAGSEIADRDLVSMIADLTAFRGRVEWDGSRPDGRRYGRLDMSRAERAFGFRARTGLREGLARAVAWQEGAAARGRLALFIGDGDQPARTGILARG